MTQQRPGRVGNYELVEEFESDEASLRILRMEKTDQAIQAHIHRRSMQIYVALQGRVAVDRDGETRRLEPYQAVIIQPETVHAAYPETETAMILNISIPPMAADDQVPVPRFEASARWGAG
jgi:mannose-6-phosphate isomerase-like protein (cupin superfamily)